MKKNIYTLLLFAAAMLLNAGVCAQDFWDELNGPYGGVADHVILPSGVHVVSSANGLFVSPDGIAAYSKVATLQTRFTDLEVSGGTVYALCGGDIYVSTDNAQNWTTTSTSSPFAGATKIKRAPNGNIYVAGSISLNSYNQVLRSTNNGVSFTTVLTATSDIRDLMVTSDNYVYITNQDGMFFSTNHGTNWTDANTGLTGSAPGTFTSYASGGIDILFTVTSSGLYKATSNPLGPSWVSTTSNITDLSFGGQLATDAANNVYYFSGAAKKIYSSADAGVSWSAPIAYPYTNISLLSAAPISPTRYSLVFSGIGIVATENSGASWTFQNKGVKAFGTQKAYYSPTGRIFMTYVQESASSGAQLISTQGYFMSADDGQTWQLTATDKIFGDFLTLGDNSILAYFGGGDIYRSTTNGNSWTLQSTQHLQNVVTNDGINLYGNNGPQLFKSIDQGVTWTSLGSFTGPAGVTEMIMDSDGNFYARDFQNSLYKILAATPTIATKITNLPSSRAFKIAKSQNNIYVTTADNFNNTFLGKSSDGGANWTLKSSPGVNGLWVHDDNNIFIATSAPGSLSVTSDGGTTWATKAYVDGTARTQDVFVSSSDYLYVAVTGGATHKSKKIAIPPKAPTSLVSSGVTYNAAALTWTDNSDNETQFEVQRSKGDKSNFETIITFPSDGSVQGKYFTTVPGLAPTSKYFFRVVAINEAGKSAFSNELEITTLAICASGIPDNRSWNGSMTILEGAASGPYSGTNVVIKRVGADPNIFSINNYSFGGINASGIPQSDPGTINFDETCGVTFFNPGNGHEVPDGNGTWDPVTKTLTLKWQTDPVRHPLLRGISTLTLNSTDPIPVTPPLKGFLFSNKEVLLNWNSNGFEQTYTIERSLASGSGFSAIATVNYPAVTYIDKDPALVFGTTYYYRIKANNAAGSSAPSAEASVALQTTLFRPEENVMNQNFGSANGVAWGDLNNDGFEDVFLPSFINITSPLIAPVIYLGGPNRQFTRVNLDVLQDELSVSWSSTILDFNNDGKNDIYVSRSADYDIVLMNNGEMSFTKVNILQTSGNAALAAPIRAAAVADFDNDKLLDVVVGYGVLPTGTKNLVLMNTGDATFSSSLTAGDVINVVASATHLSWVDYDNDRDLDLFVVNQDGPNHLYNNSGGSLTRVTGQIFDTDLLNLPRTASWGDIDNDGDLDLYIGTASFTFGAKDRLYLNNGNGTFTSQTSNTVTEPDTQTYGSVFADIDNDADLDLVVTNQARNSIFLNNGAGAFTKYAVQEMITHPDINEIGIAAADFDKDGFVDLYPAKGLGIVVELPHYLYRNVTAPSASRHWIEVKLKGTVSNTSAVGARIKLSAGGKNQIREITSHSGARGNSSLIAHFGLGTSTIIDELQILWPSGANTVLTNVPVDQILEITQDYAGPAAEEFLPAKASTAIAVNTAVTITFDEPPIAVAGKKIYITKTGSSTPVEINVTAGVITGKSITFTLASPLEFFTEYSVTLDAGAFKDQYGNVSNALTSGWTFKTLDNTPPAIDLLSAITPMIAKGFSNHTITIKVTDNAPGTVVKIYHRDSKAVDPAPYATITGTASADNFAFQIPVASFNGEGLHYYFVATDAAGNTTRSPATGTHQTLLDNTVPVIAPENLPTAVDAGFTNLKLIATVTDNLTTVTTAVLRYRALSGGEYASAAGTLNAGKYEFIIPNNGTDNNGVEFYFTATDPSGNEGRSPATGTNKALMQFTTAPVPSGVLGFGGNEADWKIFSVPFEFTNKDVATVLTDLGETKGNSRWKLLTYKDANGWSTYPDFTTLIRGQGYFINIKDRVDVSVGSNLKAPNNSRANLFQMTLKAGWNQIGNPYLSEIIWSDVVTYNNLAGKLAELKTFAGGAYVAATGLQPYEGGFVFSDAAVTLSIPFKGQTSPGGRVKEVEPITETDLSQSQWQMPLVLEQSGMQNTFSAIGMHPSASLSRDAFDDFNPPRFFRYLEMNVDHPEHLAKNFARDIVNTQGDFVWTFKVESNLEGIATIRWNNDALGDNAKELMLMDEGLQEIINMREINSYTFNPKKSNSFKVYFGENLRGTIAPTKTVLRVYPNPTTGLTNFSYSLADGESAYGVTVAVYDLMGVQVAAIRSDKMTPGFYESQWQAADKIPNGFYLCRLIVNGTKGKEIYTEKIVLNK